MIEIGQKVVCIDDSFRHINLPENFIPPKKDEMYTVREIYEHPNGVIAITVEEIINDIGPKLGREIGFNIDRFRPLDWVEDILEKIKSEIIIDEIR